MRKVFVFFVLALMLVPFSGTSQKPVHAAVTAFSILPGATCDSATFHITFSDVQANDFYLFAVDWTGDDSADYATPNMFLGGVPLNGATSVDVVVNFSPAADPARAILASGWHWRPGPQPVGDLYEISYNCTVAPGPGDDGDPGDPPTDEPPTAEDYGLTFPPSEPCRYRFGSANLYEVVTTTNLYSGPDGDELNLQILAGQTWFVVGNEGEDWLKVCIAGFPAYVPSETMVDVAEY